MISLAAEVDNPLSSKKREVPLDAGTSGSSAEGGELLPMLLAVKYRSP
jgi:hypothetical protein